MKRLIAIATALGLAACATDDGVGTLAPPDEIRTAGLGGTAWRLVEIQSMDDSTYSPGDAVFTLEFGDDGRVALRVDCNRGRAYYFADENGALTFGPVGLTRMQCPPGSLHDRYLAQLGYVRSYVRRDDRLYLATMADGAIIEYERIPASQ